LLLLRWSARDLRRKWLQVAAIALVIAIGTGVYSGLGSTATWRRESNDASFEQLAMYDLRVRMPEGVDASAGEMLSVLGALPDSGVIAEAEERLVVPTQVDASHGDETILVPGRIIGVDVADAGPHVNTVFVDARDGRTLTEADDGHAVAVLERNFAEFYDLPAAGALRLTGGVRLDYVGLGLAPEYFLVMTDEGGFFAQGNFAAVFLPLESAQELTGRPGRVNDLVLRLRVGTDAAEVAADVDALFAEAGLGATVMRTEDEDAYRVLYDDIEGDQQFWNVFAALILAGAGFGAFNLATRMVEAQRREIGIGMALGASPRQLALRPLLVGMQIALLGAALGLAIGLLVIAAIRPVYVSMLPLPTWHTDFQPAVFVRGAFLGFAIPLIATALPVWRAVRVMPVDAITVTHRTARGGLAPALRRLRWPASALRRMPIGNVLRTPKRTLLTALGIGAAISTLVAILGTLDSFVAAMDHNESELLGDHPDRVAVALDGFVTVDGSEIAAVEAAPAVGDVEPVVRVGGTLSRRDGRESFDVLVEALDLDNTMWTPTVTPSGAATTETGIIISEKAANDLGVDVGDIVTLAHPTFRSDGHVVIEDTPIVVAGTHPGPFRFNTYVDSALLAGAGLGDVANQLYVLPANASGVADVQRELFALDAVASAQPVAMSSQVVKDSLDEFTSVFRVLELFILLLALLIAYNATSINADERAKERATLFAFGLSPRRVVMFEVVEGLVTGLLGAALGIAAGSMVVRWVVTSVAASTMPDMGLDTAVSPATIATALVLGVLAVATAPLLTVRRLRRMNIPGTLRIVE
jgi:putative ABC transport system permease protein